MDSGAGMEEEWMWDFLWRKRALLLWLLSSYLLYMALRALDFFWWRPRRVEQHFARQGIMGPPYKFFLGNVKEIVGLAQEASSKPLTPPCTHNILPRVLAFYQHWKTMHGLTFLLWFGPKARVIIADPDLIREIFVSRSENYEKYESHPLIRQLEGEGLISLTGEKWAHHRKVIAPTFHMENLKLLVPLIEKTVLEVMAKWSAMSSSGKFEVDVSEWFQSMTEDAITRTAFGKSYNDGRAVFQLQAKQMVFAAEAFRNVLIPGYRFLPTQKNMDSWRLDREVKKSLVRLIAMRREISCPGPGGGGGGPGGGSSNGDDKKQRTAKDLLGLLINAGNNSNSNKMTGPTTTSSVITIPEMVEECKTFFFAGKQTTSNLLTWATVLLAMHPEWQEKACDEVLQACGSREAPTRDHVTKLKTLGMVLNETLRLYPPVVATIRRAKADVVLGGSYHIPKSTEILIPIMAVHHDPALWGPDATEFNPGRFADGVARAARHPTAFIPFGLGARTCIGQNLAMLESKLTLAIILQRYSFRLSPAYIHAPTVLMLLYPQYGAPIIFRPRERRG